MTDTSSQTISILNDRFRATFVGGRVVMTPCIGALSEAERAAILAAVQSFNDFSEDNDPHGEHDFGAFEINSQRYYFKIDYYDTALEYASDDPANPDVTTRVLTIMLASEY